jgi:hypothetical protein
VWRGKHRSIELTVDHDHDHCRGAHGCRLCSRWLLCNGCNVLMGQAGERVAVLRAAADMLEDWGASRNAPRDGETKPT